MGWARVGEARGQESRSQEGMLGPCHGGGKLATGQRSGRRGAREEGPAGAGWGGGRCPSDAWSGQELEVAPGTVDARHMAGEGGGVRREAGQRGKQRSSRGARGRRRGEGVRGTCLQNTEILGAYR
jgi:hypothetical protein